MKPTLLTTMLDYLLCHLSNPPLSECALLHASWKPIVLLIIMSIASKAAGLYTDAENIYPVLFIRPSSFAKMSKLFKA